MLSRVTTKALAGCAIVTTVEAAQLFPSTAVYVYEPAINPLVAGVAATT
jgi:hypothetical protein